MRYTIFIYTPEDNSNKSEGGKNGFNFKFDKDKSYRIVCEFFNGWSFCLVF